MAAQTIVVIGASAGGLAAFSSILGALPANFPAAVCVIQHLQANGPSLLPELLAAVCPLPVQRAHDGQAIQAGTVYVGVPDRHLLIQAGHLHLVRGPKENGFRPAIDAGMRSAALAYGAQVIGVILTGMLDDGTAGLLAVKRRGGVAIVQDPAEAEYPSMPQSACRYVAVDSVCLLAEIAPRLVQLTATSSSIIEDLPMYERTEQEARITALDQTAITQSSAMGTPSTFSCPDCGGVLAEYYDDELLRYRCQIGHVYSPESFLEQQGESMDVAVWAAFRSLKERSNLADRLVRDADRLNDRIGVQRFTNLREQAEAQQARLYRFLVGQDERSTDDDDSTPAAMDSSIDRPQRS